MTISLYFLKKYKLNKHIYKSLSAKGVMLVDFFIKDNIQNKYNNISPNWIVETNKAVEEYLSQISKLENVFDSVEMLGNLNLLTKDISDIKAKSIKEIVQQNFDDENLEKSLKKYNKILELHTIKKEKEIWEAFILFFNNTKVTEQELQLQGINNDIIEEFLNQNIIIKDNIPPSWYVINKEVIVFQEALNKIQNFSKNQINNINNDNQENAIRVTDESTSTNQQENIESISQSKEEQLTKIGLRGKLKNIDMNYQKRWDIEKEIQADNELKQKDIVSFGDYITDLRETCPVFYMKLKGYSDLDICEIQSITIIELSNIVNDNLEKMPIILELEYYSEIYQHFDIPKEIFIKTFNLQRAMYKLLSLKNTKGINPIFLNKNMCNNKRIYEALKDEQNRIQTTNSVKLTNLKVSYLEKLILNYLDEHILYKSIHIFNLYNEKTDIPKYKFTNLKYFEIFLNKVRYIEKVGDYYKLNPNGKLKPELPIPNVMQFLNLLVDGIYDISIIRKYASHIMEGLSITSNQEFIVEFQNITSDISFHEDKILIIGNYTKQSFINEKLNQFTNRTVEEFLNYMNQNFGLNIIDLQKYLYEEFDGNISAEGNIISSDEIDIVKLKQCFTEKLYLKNKFEKILFENGIEEINQELLNSLGFNSKENFMYSLEFSSLGQAIEDRILNNKIYEIESDEFYGNYNVYNAIYKLEKEYQIFTLSQGKYFVTKYLDNKDEVINDFKDFISSVENYVESEKYFSINSLVNSGFEHRILNDGFEFETLDRLLKNSQKLISLSIGNNNTTLYIKSNHNKTIADFLTKKINETGNIVITELIENLNEEYGISLVETTIVRKVIELGYFYSKPLDKVYLDKNDYLDEVYG